MTDGRAAGDLRFEILGEVRALRGGEPVDLGPAKQRAVLAVLLLQAGRPVPTHQIVDAVWGDEPPENGANVVQKYVAGLRRALDPDRAPRTPGELLSLTGGGYVLRTADCDIDADEFQTAVSLAAVARAAGDLASAAGTLRGGLGLWRGEALAGLTGPVFDAARQRLAETKATAWEKWAEIELAMGESTALIPDLARLVEEFPLREGLRAQLMIALHQGGRQAEALAAFRDAREFFLEEFGAEPGEKMQEAHRRILRGEPHFAPDAPPASPALPVSPAPPVSSAPPVSPAPLSAPGLAVEHSFYSEPADPWAGSSDPLPHADPMISAVAHPPYPTYQTYQGQLFPSPVPGAPPAFWVQQRRRSSVLDVVLALLLPALTCLVGGWVYFVIAGVRRRDPRQYLVAAAYFMAFVVLVMVTFVLDPTPVDSEELSTAEGIGMTCLFALPVLAAVHGLALAVNTGYYEHVWTQRQLARQFAQISPDRAREMGIGRPDLPRGYDDGGLIDLNHLGADGLARAAGLSLDQAQQIVTDRQARGPFRYPDDLVMRRLATKRTMRRLAPRLICIPPR